jgi:hypothetical protein
MRSQAKAGVGVAFYTTKEGRDGEIKAAPSAGLQVVGFAGEYAPSLLYACRRLDRNP